MNTEATSATERELTVGLRSAEVSGYISEAHQRESIPRGSEANLPPVLDVCCGPRMFWFDKKDERALFIDKRRENLEAESVQGRVKIVIDPDMLGDFTKLPFNDATFTLVVFDPPHTWNGPNGWNGKKYGSLSPNWREEIKAGFAECFRVLAPLGTLIFKWNEHRVPVSAVLALTPERPLFGNRCGKTAKSHWIVFHKGAVAPAPQRYNEKDQV